ncbi:MAG: Rpn family recombination-promoting nuclease/putative transposase [Patescibacteria group bacterium]|nr:Rpn family recombination-promoting nuclease/putative transposase [Patescibacteria group bacterium]
MELGIDPKNDYAFKCLFGSEHHTRILVHLLNAVLDPAPGGRVESVVILNPSFELVSLDEKMSILDIRARDQSGRQFDIEMQMASHPGLRDRFLLYWARLYASQSRAGDGYELLNPVISICFLDWRLFPQADRYHLPFRLQEPETGLVFSEHLAIHVFQLPNFKKGPDELTDSLDKWLYFLNNGEGLNPEDLPESIRIPEVEEAMSVLKALTEEERSWNRYFDREKARRDAASWQSWIDRTRTEAEHAAARAEQAEAEAKQAAARAEQAEAKVEQAAARAKQAEAKAEKVKVEGLIGQVRLCEELQNLSPTPAEQLDAMRPDDLRQLVDQLRHRHGG